MYAMVRSSSLRRVRLIAPVLTAATIIGCNAVDPSAGPGSGSGPDLGPLTIGASSLGNILGTAETIAPHSDNLTPDQAYHLLRRAAFGATPKQVQEAVARGLSATVDDLLRTKPVPSSVTTLAESYEHNVPPRWLVHMIEGPNPLLERMMLFWHDRFAASSRVAGGRDRNLGVVHLNLLRRNALGNYRTFLRELTIDPLMLLWLDGANSPKQSPNENYAREFWELFTLGRDNLYTEADIRESARAFTGITILRESEQDPRPIFDILFHDETTKTVFPSRGAGPTNHDYLSIIDLTLKQPEAARYVARNLFVFFVHDHPSEAVVNSLAETFVAADFEIEPLVRRILTSDAFFAADAVGNQITSPVEHYVGIARTFDLHIPKDESERHQFNSAVRELRDAGQELLNPPGVEGWTEGSGWLQDQWLLNRARALGRSMEYGPERTADLPYHLLPDRSEWDQRDIRGRIVDAVAEVLHLKLSDQERDVYIEVLDQNGWRALHLEEPDRQPRQVAEMIRLMTMDGRVITR
jgi:Protein of unknown function (DUF1800)